MTDKIKLIDTLKSLDPANAELWTDDGLPRVNVVQKLMDDTTITRATLDAMAPGFARSLDGGGQPELKAAEPEDNGDEPLPSETETGGDKLTEAQMRVIYTKRIDTAALALDNARKAVSVAQREVENCIQRLGRAQGDANRRFPPMSAAQAIKVHLAAQQKQRMEMVAANGSDPLSAAMAQKRFRPVRPVLNGQLIVQNPNAPGPRRALG